MKKAMFFILFLFVSTNFGMHLNYFDQSDSVYINNEHHESFYRNWDKVNTQDVQFPENFLWGIGTSHHQIAGSQFSTWSEGSPYAQVMEEQWAKEGKKFSYAHSIGADLKTMKKDIKELKKLGFNVYRFSIEWSDIEPQEGYINKEALLYYEKLCTKLIKNNIIPFVTLHHYTDPLWFMDKGGFEKEENIHYFVRYCNIIFEKLHSKAFYWCTFNAPEAYAIKGYYNGMAIPNKKNMHLMATVLKNMLAAHVQVYSSLKIQYVHENHQIGIIKNIYELEEWDVCNPLDYLGTYIGNYLVNDCVFNFFSTGLFKVYIPFIASVNYQNDNAMHSLDFIGINYYSHRFMNNFKLVNTPREEPTDNENYSFYPDGLSKAIKQVSEKVAVPCNIPIIITENGISTNDPSLRKSFLEKSIYIVSEMQKKHNISGYFYWSLYDNYEWGTYDKKYGMFAINSEKNQRALKPGFEPLFNAIHLKH